MNHDHLQPPRTSASTPCTKGNMAPPTTPIMNTPEATEVYFPKWATDKVKISSPHDGMEQTYCREQPRIIQKNGQ